MMRLSVLTLALLAAVVPPVAQASDESSLSDVFGLIQAHSQSNEEDYTSHLETLEEDRAKLARSIQKALDSFKSITESTDFSKLRYRRHDGLGNNLKHPFWGATLHTERRLLPNAYNDGSFVPRYRSASGQVLPSAREVSMKCFKPDDSPRNLDNVLTQLHMQFGQFLDHDIILTELDEGADCCDGMLPDGTHPDMFNRKACFPIKVGPNDRYFNKQCLRARRSVGVEVDGVRQQINAITSYIDGSQVYGPAKPLADELRSFVDGKLKTTKQLNKRGEVLHEDLPQLGVFMCLNKTINLDHCPHAGDPRANVFPGLTIMHTAFHLEHNRIAGKLKKINRHWDDERLYQEARKIVIATLQKIVYTEYLPKLIGPQMMEIFGFNDPYSYNDSVDASIMNAFGADAFRFGHSQINGHLKISGTRNPALSEIYFLPEIMLEKRGATMKNIIVHQARQRCQKTDNLFSPEVLDKLFLNVDNPGESFDLPAFAVHRSRDHGLPPYVDYLNHVLKFLSRQSNIDGLVPNIDLPKCLMNGIYEELSDVDLFVGGLYEIPVAGGAVGPTFAYIIAEQFKRLRDGDRFFYQTSDRKIGFSNAQLQDIEKKSSLANVICKNNPRLPHLQLRALEEFSRRDNPNQDCKKFPDFNFGLWGER